LSHKCNSALNILVLIDHLAFLEIQVGVRLVVGLLDEIALQTGVVEVTRKANDLVEFGLTWEAFSELGSSVVCVWDTVFRCDRISVPWVGREATSAPILLRKIPKLLLKWLCLLSKCLNLSNVGIQDR
jgi:hypothetical protein